MEKDCASSNSIAVTSDWKEKSLNYLKKFSTEKKFPECPETSLDLLKSKETIQKKTVLLQEEAERIKKELKNVKDKVEENVDKYNLYTSITNITWNLENLSKQSSDAQGNIIWDLESHASDVQGYVSKPLNVFKFNTETQSKFEIANNLWELIGGDVKALSESP